MQASRAFETLMAKSWVVGLWFAGLGASPLFASDLQKNTVSSGTRSSAAAAAGFRSNGPASSGVGRFGAQGAGTSSRCPQGMEKVGTNPDGSPVCKPGQKTHKCQAGEVLVYGQCFKRDPQYACLNHPEKLNCPHNAKPGVLNGVYTCAFECGQGAHQKSLMKDPGDKSCKLECPPGDFGVNKPESGACLCRGHFRPLYQAYPYYSFWRCAPPPGPRDTCKE